MLLAYCFIQLSLTYNQVSQEICLTSGDDSDDDSDGTGISSATISKFYSHFSLVIGRLYTLHFPLLLYD